MKSHKIILATLFLLVAGTAMAQHIKGTVKDNHGNPLPYTTVKALSLPDSALITGGITGEDGSFGLELGNHKLPIVLEASLIGFTSQKITTSNLSDNVLVLTESATMLGEFAVTANRIPHKLVAGGLSTSVEASPLSQLPSVYSVLRGIPLVEVEGESIKITGKGTPVIYINDRLMTDPNQLRLLKPSLIKNIEVITNPGAKYSSSTDAVLKIYTKREPGSGLSGEVRLKLSEYIGRPMSYNPSVSVNYRMNNWDFFADVSYNQSYGVQMNKDLKVEGKTPNSEWLNQSELKYVWNNQYQSYTVGVNYEDEVQSAGFKYSLFGENEESDGYSVMNSSLDQKAPITYYSQNHTTDPWNYSHRPSLYYLRKLGDWKAQVDIDYYQTSMDHEIQNVREGNTDQYELRTVTSTHGAQYRSFGTRIDASGPLWGGNLNVGGEFSWVRNKFYNYNDASLNLPDLDNNQKEQLYTLYTEYNHSIFKEWELSLGLRLEHFDNKYYVKDVLDPDRTRRATNIFPTFSLGGKLWGMNTQLSFRSKLTHPSYWRLQPQYIYVSRYEYQAGDPNLRPQIDYTSQLMLNKSWLTVLLGHSYSVGCLTQEAQLMDDPKNPGQKIPYVILLKAINADPHHALSATVIASPTIKWWNPTLTVRMEKLIGYDLWIFDQKITNRKPTLVVALNNQFNLPKDIYASLNMTYVPFGSDDNMQFIKPILQSYAQISKQWLKNKNLTTTFSVDNIFNIGARVRVPTKYTVIESTAYQPTFFVFTASYRFNATKNKFKGTGALESVIDRM